MAAVAFDLWTCKALEMGIAINLSALTLKNHSKSSDAGMRPVTFSSSALICKAKR